MVPGEGNDRNAPNTSKTGFLETHETSYCAPRKGASQEA